MDGDGAQLRGAGRQAERRRPRRDQPRDRRRRREEGRLAQPDGPVHPRRRQRRLQGVPRQVRGPDPQDPRERADRGRLPGHEHHADQPRRPRDRRLGAATDDGPGNDHRHRLDRLPPGVGAGDSGPDQGAGRLEGHDDDLDLRPPDHPGRRVGLVPAPDRPAPRRRGRVLRGRGERARGRRVGRLEGARGIGIRPAARRRHDDRLADLGGRGAARRGAPAGGPGGHLTAQGLPDPRSPLREPEPARRRRQGRPGARAREPEPDARADGADPRLDPADRRPGRDPARRAAADARRLLRHRSPTRSSTCPRTSNGCGCGR